jgi:beta-D-xylosidase 4
MEVPGEDPMATGEYGREFVHAMQARNGTQQRAMCMPKHWLAYDLEGRKTTPVVNFSRNSFDALISKQGMVEFYLPAWHATVRSGQASGVMCSTNSINGVDACMNPLYLHGFLRDRFNFTGAVVTDGGSCGNPNCVKTAAAINPKCAGCPSLQAANSTPGCPLECGALGAKLCLESGTDIELGTLLSDFSSVAIAQGLLKESTVAASNVHLYANLIRAGLYDATADDTLGAADVDTQRARQIAFEAATDAMVLLKNAGNVLPLARGAGAKPVRIALIGPHLTTTTDLLSSIAYTHDRTSGPPFATIEAAFKARASEDFVISGTALGCDIISGCLTADVAGVKAAVVGADIVLAFVGLHPSSGAVGYPGFGTNCSESEAQDRINIALCGQQQAVIEAAKVAAGPSTKLVVVMINGGTIDLTWVRDNADAIVNGWYPGQSGGNAVAAVIFGDRAPSGRLPVTLYSESIVSSRGLGDMDLRSADGLTYMHYTGTPIYPFGFGLSYTKWAFALTPPPTTVLSTTTVAVAADYAAYYSPAAAGNRFVPSTVLPITISNVGVRRSSVVVQVFAVLESSPPVGAIPMPRRQLVGFERAPDVAVGETRTVQVGIAPLGLCRVDTDGAQWAEAGRWTLSATFDGLSFTNTSLTIVGTRMLVMSWPNTTSI